MTITIVITWPRGTRAEGTKTWGTRSLTVLVWWSSRITHFHLICTPCHYTNTITIGNAVYYMYVYTLSLYKHYYYNRKPDTVPSYIHCYNLKHAPEKSMNAQCLWRLVLISGSSYVIFAWQESTPLGRERWTLSKFLSSHPINWDEFHPFLTQTGN